MNGSGVSGALRWPRQLAGLRVRSKPGNPRERGAVQAQPRYDRASPDMAESGRPANGSWTHEGLPLGSMESTLDILARAKTGDRFAVDLLFQRIIPSLRRWARGRLPTFARGMADTQDVVQDAVFRTLHNLDNFEPRHQGALQAYLRQAVANRIRDEIRQSTRHPAPSELTEALQDAGPTPLERAIGVQGLERYDAALTRLRPSDREAIVARMELQQSYEEVAVALGKPTPEAARAAVTRALARLVEELDRES